MIKKNLYLFNLEKFKEVSRGDEDNTMSLVEINKNNKPLYKEIMRINIYKLLKLDFEELNSISQKYNFDVLVELSDIKRNVLYFDRKGSYAAWDTDLPSSGDFDLITEQTKKEDELINDAALHCALDKEIVFCYDDEIYKLK